MTMTTATQHDTWIQLRRRERHRQGQRVTPNQYGTNICVDFPTLHRARLRDGRSVYRLMHDIGYHPSTWDRIRERGTCKLATADALCNALGIDLWEVETS